MPNLPPRLVFGWKTMTSELPPGDYLRPPLCPVTVDLVVVEGSDPSDGNPSFQPAYLLEGGIDILRMIVRDGKSDIVPLPIV